MRVLGRVVQDADHRHAVAAQLLGQVAIDILGRDNAERRGADHAEGRKQRKSDTEPDGPDRRDGIGHVQCLENSKTAGNSSPTGPPKAGGYSVRMLAKRKAARNVRAEVVGWKSEAYSAKWEGALSVTARGK